MLSTIWEWIRNIASIVAVLSFVVEFTPIKLHPLTFVFHTLGGAFNKDLNEKIDNLNKEVNDLKKDLLETESSLKEKIDSNDRKQSIRHMKNLRSEILSFSSSCMHKERHTKNEFENFFDNHKEYEDLISELGMTNGVVDEEFEYTKEVYHDCLMNDSFL